MTKHQKYFIKQKLFGALGILLAALTIHWLDGDATVAIILAIPSLVLIFSKKMWIVDNYYIDVMDEKKKKSKRL